LLSNIILSWQTLLLIFPRSTRDYEKTDLKHCLTPELKEEVPRVAQRVRAGHQTSPGAFVPNCIGRKDHQEHWEVLIHSFPIVIEFKETAGNHALIFII
jgi:hypothetical protein